MATADGGLGVVQRDEEREYARRFAAEHEHFDDDLGFWRTAAARLGGPILDAGCATGRVAIALAQEGHEVWAMDSSQAMLDELMVRLGSRPDEVRGRVHPVCARMQEFALGQQFRAVIVAMNTMQLLLALADRVAAMRRLAEHLAPGGELLLDVARLDSAEVRGALGTEVPITAHRRANGALQAQVARYEAFEETTRTLEFSIDISEAHPGSPSVSYLRRHTIHMYQPGEIEDLAIDAGLSVLEVTGDFAGGPSGPDADHQVFRLGHARDLGADQ